MDKKHNLVFVDTNLSAVKRLEEDLIRKYSDRLDVHIITDPAYAEEYFDSTREIDLLLIPEEDAGAFLHEQHIRQIFLLRSSVIEEEPERYARHQKVMMAYLPKEELFEEISDFFARLDLEQTPENKQTMNTPRIIAVYSPIGGCGKSLISIGLARKLKKLDQKVLLVGCDDLQSFEVFLEQNEYAGDDLAEELRNPGEDTYWTVLENIGYDDFSYLKPFVRVPHAVGVGRTQWRAFVELMREKNDFDFIVLDIGTRVDEAGVALMERADEIVLLTEPTITAMRKMARIAGDETMLPQKKCVLISNQYHSDGLRYSEEAIFDSLPAYLNWQEALEDPLFYRLALSMQDR